MNKMAIFRCFVPLFLGFAFSGASCSQTQGARDRETTDDGWEDDHGPPPQDAGDAGELEGELMADEDAPGPSPDGPEKENVSDSEDAPDTGPTDTSDPDLQVAHDWTPVLTHCKKGFSDCSDPGWYLTVPAFLRLDAEGDVEGGGCHAALSVNDQVETSCQGLPCDAEVVVEKEVLHVVVEGRVTCWGESRDVVKDFSVFKVQGQEHASCVRWGDWEKTAFVFPDPVSYYGPPRLALDDQDLLHLVYGRSLYPPSDDKLAYLFQTTENQWLVEYPSPAPVDGSALMGMTITPDAALQLLTLDRRMLDEDWIRGWVVRRVRRDGLWLPATLVMPATLYHDSMFTLVADEDGRLDGLMYILRPTEEFCGEPEWAWVCELLGDVQAGVLLRFTETSDGSWNVTKSYSPGDWVGVWMSTYVQHFLYHFDLNGMGSAALLANEYYVGFLSLLPGGVEEAPACTSGTVPPCANWAIAAPGPGRDSIVALVLTGLGEGPAFERLQFVPGLPVARGEVPWSADVAGYGLGWPLFVTDSTTSAGYQQMVIDSLARTHLAISFLTQDGPESVTLYIREYPDGQGHEWQIEPIDEPGIPFLIMDSKANVHVLMFNNNEFDGPKGIQLLTRRCEEYLPGEE